MPRRKSRSRRARLEVLEVRNLLTLPTLVHHHNLPDLTAEPSIWSVADGDWHDASIWSLARTPRPDDVVAIRSGHEVSLAAGSADVRGLGVHGELELSAPLRLVDFVVYRDGTLNMQTGTDVVFADTPLRGDDDPLQWGNGLIVLGDWTAHGDAKTPYLRATNHISAGATSFVAAAVPDNWQVGDLLVLPETAQTRVTKEGTQLQQSETVRIAAIDGASIMFSPPARFDHRGISPNPFQVERFAHVGNLSRSIVIRSEDPSGVRGHVAATVDADLEVHGVEFVGLGRTKAQPVDNTSVSQGEIVHQGSNQIGRYPLHLHFVTGSFDVSGNVIRDGLKWGIAIHESSNGRIADNVVFDTDGAGIATEASAEIANEIVGNLVVNVDGGYQTGDARAGASEVLDWRGNTFFDTGSEGSGFWFRGPANFVERNVVYDAAGYAFNYNGYWLNGDGSVTDKSSKQVLSFRANEAVASFGGLWASWSQTCCNIDLFEEQVFEDLLVWHASRHGVKAYHEARMVLRDVTVVSNPAVASANEGSPWYVDRRNTIGFDFGNPSYENHDLRMENLRASGANVGILAPVNAGAGALLDGAHLQNYVNIAFADGARQDSLTIDGVAFSPTFVKRISRVEPELPTDIWDQTAGIVDPGDAAGGDSGADRPRIPNLPPRVKLLDDGRLRVDGGEGADIASLTAEGDSFRLLLDNSVVSVPREAVTAVWFFGNGGNDSFDNMTGLPLLAVGGDGDDTLVGGAAADDIRGGAGDDLLLGRRGNDVLYGEEGDDELHGNLGEDRLRGGDGHDLLFGGLGSDPVVSGDSGNDRIDGGAGDDAIQGGEGDDILLGGAGADTIDGGNGDDILLGEAAVDVLTGGAGSDQLIGGAEGDKLHPGPGADRLAPTAADVVFLAEAEDAITRVGSAESELAHFDILRLRNLLVSQFGFSMAEATDRLPGLSVPSLPSAVLLSESAGNTRVTREDTAGDSYQIVLATIPANAVVVTATPPQSLDLGAGPGVAISLTFSTTTALTPQTVIVRLAGGNIDHGDFDDITHRVTSLDSSYQGLAVPNVRVLLPEIPPPPPPPPSVPLPTVRQVIVNDGSRQRSIITSLSVTFSTIVEVGPDAFELINLDTGQSVAVIGTVQQGLEETTVTLRFGQGPAVITRPTGNSLANGRYQLRVKSAAVVAAGQMLDGNGDGQAGDDHLFGDLADGLFRLFGDHDGNQAVDTRDYFEFLGVYSESQPPGSAGHTAVFDADGDGKVDDQDFNAFFSIPGFDWVGPWA